jgi:enolase
VKKNDLINPRTKKNNQEFMFNSKLEGAGLIKKEEDSMDEEPTQAQVDLAEKLADEYDIDLSEIPFTKKDYSEFITEFKDF